MILDERQRELLSRHAYAWGPAVRAKPATALGMGTCIADTGDNRWYRADFDSQRYIAWIPCDPPAQYVSDGGVVGVAVASPDAKHIAAAIEASAANTVKAVADFAAHLGAAPPALVRSDGVETPAGTAERVARQAFEEAKRLEGDVAALALSKANESRVDSLASRVGSIEFSRTAAIELTERDRRQIAAAHEHAGRLDNIVDSHHGRLSKNTEASNVLRRELGEHGKRVVALEATVGTALEDGAKTHDAIRDSVRALASDVRELHGVTNDAVMAVARESIERDAALSTRLNAVAIENAKEHAALAGALAALSAVVKPKESDVAKPKICEGPLSARGEAAAVRCGDEFRATDVNRRFVAAAMPTRWVEIGAGAIVTVSPEPVVPEPAAGDVHVDSWGKVHEFVDVERRWRELAHADTYNVRVERAKTDREATMANGIRKIAGALAARPYAIDCVETLEFVATDTGQRFVTVTAADGERRWLEVTAGARLTRGSPGPRCDESTLGDVHVLSDGTPREIDPRGFWSAVPGAMSAARVREITAAGAPAALPTLPALRVRGPRRELPDVRTVARGSLYMVDDAVEVFIADERAVEGRMATPFWRTLTRAARAFPAPGEYPFGTVLAVGLSEYVRDEHADTTEAFWVPASLGTGDWVRWGAPLSAAHETEGDDMATTTKESKTSELAAALKDNAQDAAWRTAGKQFVKLARDPLAAAIGRHLAPDDDAVRAKLAAFLLTDVGTAVMAAALSLALTGVAQLGGKAAPIAGALASELRVRAMSEGGDLLADLLMGPLRELMATTLRDVAPMLETTGIRADASEAPALSFDEEPAGGVAAATGLRAVAK